MGKRSRVFVGGHNVFLSPEKLYELNPEGSSVTSSVSLWEYRRENRQWRTQDFHSVEAEMSFIK